MPPSFQATKIRARYISEKLKRTVWPVTWRQEAPFDDRRRVFYEAFWREAALNIGADVERLGYGFLRISKSDKSTIVNQHRVMLDHYLLRDIVDNKPLIHRLLNEMSVPVPAFAEFNLNSFEVARDFLERVGGCAVVKPASGTGGGQGVTTKVTRQTLESAAIYAAVFGTSLLIEREVVGDCFRLLYLDGNLVDAIRRDPPRVVGDGASSIRQLIAEENARRLHDTGTVRALTRLSIDDECLLTLRSQGRTLRDVPRRGERVIVKTVISDNCRAENHRVNGSIHSSIERMGSDIVCALGIRLAGLDIMTTDISKPLHATRGAVVEINIPPGLHYHSIVAEQDTNPPLGEMILNRIFEECASQVAVSERWGSA
jgi:D-alanine-D-alanine ligase-like ATP-grasp enzyme